jgi:hypothetical protein
MLLTSSPSLVLKDSPLPRTPAGTPALVRIIVPRGYDGGWYRRTGSACRVTLAGADQARASSVAAIARMIGPADPVEALKRVQPGKAPGSLLISSRN